MSRLSIELTPQQHQKLKALAALHGKSIKQMVLEPSLADVQDMGDEHALRELENLLKPRIAAAHQGDVSSRTPQQILESVQNILR